MRYRKRISRGHSGRKQSPDPDEDPGFSYAEMDISQLGDYVDIATEKAAEAAFFLVLCNVLYDQRAVHIL